MQQPAMEGSPSSEGGQDPRDIRLPVIRPDVEIHPGPRAPDGSPTFTIYDPLARSYDKIGWAEALLLERLHRPMSLGDLMDGLERETSLRFTAEEILAFARDLDGRGLTLGSSFRDVEELEKEARARRTSPLRWLLFHYLYFRIPLIRPDGFLERTLPLARIPASRGALALYLVLSALGLFFLVERFSSYINTFSFFFNLQGMLVYGAAIIAIKVLHEFSHAYTAKGMGVRVPTMGVAFIVLWPVAFCDVTDAWKLADRKQRLLIGASGMLSEVIVAGLALFGWGITEPGMAHSVFFVLSSVTLLSTLLINLNPAMRYDGYYILMDAWGVDNLQTRAFAVARWALRKWLLGLDMKPPETPLRRRRVAAMVIYSIYCWIYRLTLYLAIAALVYYKFTKIIGIFLFCVEIYWFIVLPFVREVQALFRLRGNMRFNPRNGLTLLCVLGVLAWFCAPLPRSYSVPGILIPRTRQIVYAPSSGVIRDMGAMRDQHVSPGEPLLSIESEELKARLIQLKAKRNILEQQKFILALAPDGRGHVSEKQDEIESVEAQISSLSNQLEQNRILAEIHGQIYEWDENLYEGQPVARDQIIGRIASLDDVFAYAFVDEDHVGDVAIGDQVAFYPVSGGDEIGAVVVQVSPVNMESIQRDTMLSRMQKDLPIKISSRGTLVLMKSYYLVELELAAPGDRLRLEQRGRVWLRSLPRSLLLDAMFHAYKVLIKESGF